MTVKHSFPSFWGLSASIPYVLKFTATVQQEEVSGQVTILTSKSLLAPREIQLNGIPLILELGRAPADRNVGAAPKAASHLLSTLFPLPRGCRRGVISGRKMRIPGENVNRIGHPCNFLCAARSTIKQLEDRLRWHQGFLSHIPLEHLIPAPRVPAGEDQATATSACREMFPPQDWATSANYSLANPSWEPETHRNTLLFANTWLQTKSWPGAKQAHLINRI